MLDDGDCLSVCIDKRVKITFIVTLDLKLWKLSFFIFTI